MNIFKNKDDCKLSFHNCLFSERDIKRILCLTSNLSFIDCKMKKNNFISLETFYKIIQHNIKVNNSIILIYLQEINKSDFINFFSRLDFFRQKYNLKKVNIILSGLRCLKLPSTLKRIHKNKLRVGCKAMTLEKWYTFFNYEEYVFIHVRKSKEFIEMRENFNKIYSFLIELKSNFEDSLDFKNFAIK